MRLAQWQAVYAARVSGATWKQTGAATETTATDARAEYLATLENQEQVRPGSTVAYRKVL